MEDRNAENNKIRSERKFKKKRLKISEERKLQKWNEHQNVSGILRGRKKREK